MTARQRLLAFAAAKAPAPAGIALDLLRFRGLGKPTAEGLLSLDAGGLREVPVYTNEFWTARQRAAHSLHEISYRACFKPQLPGFFIERLTKPGDRVYDPFMGRGTALLEAALLGRRPLGCDANPLSALLAGPRFAPPSEDAVRDRLASLDLHAAGEMPEDLLVFFHPDTLREISALRRHLLEKGKPDAVDAWIRMVTLNRLTGHSSGFLSVYTLPPNQAVSVGAQRKINLKRRQIPPYRDLKAVLLKKTKSLLADVRPDLRMPRPVLLTGDAASTPSIRGGSVRLVVTSPPFLDVVDYASDNWLRCWFAGVDPAAARFGILKRLGDWQAKMTEVFRELRRVLAPGGHVAFEVGEVRGGKVRLEEVVIPAAVAAGLEPVLVLIHQQEFTKTAKCWGVDNNLKGTNSNRVVLLRK